MTLYKGLSHTLYVLYIQSCTLTYTHVDGTGYEDKIQLTAFEEWCSVPKFLNKPTSSAFLDCLDGDGREVD